jgi:hypothetical protein
LKPDFWTIDRYYQEAAERLFKMCRSPNHRQPGPAEKRVFSFFELFSAVLNPNGPGSSLVMSMSEARGTIQKDLTNGSF